MSAVRTETPSGGLAVEKISAGYRGRIVLKEMSLTVSPGELVVLAGPNGSGKTTLLKTIAGFIKPLSGRILMRGSDISLLKNRSRAALCAFLFQEPGSRWPFTVEELVSQGRFFFKGPGNEQAVSLEQALESAGLGGFGDRLITELSGGEYQRVLIARAVYQGAPFLLLDEPANNLDPKYQIMMMELLKNLSRRGLSALVSLHDLNLAALYADRVALLSNGELMALAPPAEALRRETLEAVFNAPFGIAPHPELPVLPLVYPRRR
jgi:iron complex transport system ATP-binding protein